MAVIGEFASLWQAAHALSDLYADKTIVDLGCQVVQLDDAAVRQDMHCGIRTCSCSGGSLRRQKSLGPWT
jgi:hypothetical protein